MTESNQGNASRREHAIDSRAITDKVLRRDQRRIWIFGIICVFAWMIVVMLPWATVLPMMAKVVKHQTDRQLNGEARTYTEKEQQEAIDVLRIVKTGTIATFVGSVASMFFAAVCTIGLVLYSRRSTMRQVSARLADISAQLKLLAEKSR
jgi:ABC-type Fe3+ transport system permease subunit